MRNRCQWIAMLAVAALAIASQPWALDAAPEHGAALKLAPCRLPSVTAELRCGTYEVFEDRQGHTGRKLPLKVVLLPARRAVAGHDPVFMFAGGPGQTATELVGYFEDGWERDENDVIFIDQRGTGDGHRLDCNNLPGSPDDLQGYFEPVFDARRFRACREQLEKIADLALYSTPIAMDDVDEVRAALGYDKIILDGGSYGSRALLTYVRQHGDHVRSAWIINADPFALKNPLSHARSAQESFDGLVTQCRLENACRRAYPDPSADLKLVLEQLAQKPARVRFEDSATGRWLELMLSRDGFAEGLRAMLYNSGTQLRIPYMLARARHGDLAPFASAALNSRRALRDALRYGMLQSVVCSEDIARIRPGEIERETAGTFLGDVRVRDQLAACQQWPKSRLPEQFATPFESEVPALIVSADLDPATPPRWGEKMAVYFPNSIHAVVPGGHASDNECAASLGRQLFANRALAELDTSCLRNVRERRFYVPENGAEIGRRAGTRLEARSQGGL